MDRIFLLGVIYVFKKFLYNSSTFLNVSFWAGLKGRPSEIIRSAMAIVKRALLEVIIFLELPSIAKTSEPFENFHELLSVVMFDAEVKPEISHEIVSFHEVIILLIRLIVDSMAADDLLCRLVMDALIFSE